ncbi:MAG: hypothetical protein GY913_08365 [Proteobacteria bacterium]|nr:hypothetical protein [Pseudomonadota bacterium]MCP4916923.1 hypothetical protein [Pseudomonadota bacterium]
MAHSPDFERVCQEARDRIVEIDVETALGEPWTLVDVREDREFRAGRMPGAVHIGRGVLERDVEKHFAKDAPLALYCGGGFRSALAADMLQQMGFTDVRSVAGGIKAWWRGLDDAGRTIDFYYDVVCPYAYMAATRLEALAERQGTRVRWIPILLGGVFKSIEAPQVPAATWSASRQVLIAQDLTRNAARHGLDFELPEGHPRRSVEAMRLVVGAPANAQRDLALELWSSTFEKGADTRDRSTLERIGARHGVSIDVIDDPAVKARLRENTAQAVARGVFGVPSMFAGEHFFYGQDRLVFLERALGGAWPVQPSSSSGETIEFFHDFSSPFSYLASTQVEAVAARHGATLRYRPILLGGLFRSIGTPDVPMNAMSPAKQRYVTKDLQDQASRFGVPLRFTSHFPLRTILPLRVSIVQPRTIQALYAASWAGDQDMGDPQVVARVLDEAGFDGAALIAATQDPDVKAELRSNTELAAEIGVCGAPTFRVRGQLYWGADRLDHVEDALRG